MWRNKISIEKLKNGKFAVRVVRMRKKGLVFERQRLTKSLSFVKAVEGENIDPCIICTEVKTW